MILRIAATRLNLSPNQPAALTRIELRTLVSYSLSPVSCSLIPVALPSLHPPNCPPSPDRLPSFLHSVPMLHEAIAHYRVLRQLGNHGMAVVYAAEDTKLGR